MSLIKLAINIAPFIIPAFGTRAAKSGNPLKYLFSRADKNRILPVRKHLQRTSLSMLGQLEAGIRKGRVQDSTKLLGSALDAQLGHVGKFGVGLLEDIHKSKTPKAEFAKYLLKKTINDNGTYNIKEIKSILNKSKNLYDKLEKVKNIPIVTGSTLTGAGVGYLTGKKDKKGKAAFKGALFVGTLGLTARGSLNKITKSQTYNMIPKIHNEFFKDSYWVDQLTAANNSKFHKATGKLSAKLLTSTPEKRLAREKASQAWTKLMETDVKDYKTLKNNFKDLKNKVLISYQKPNKIKNYYSSEL